MGTSISYVLLFLTEVGSLAVEVAGQGAVHVHRGQVSLVVVVAPPNTNIPGGANDAELPKLAPISCVVD